MSFLSIEEFKELVEQPQGLCVSIYMPTVQLGSETQQNSVRFKNLIRQAEEQLKEHELRPTDTGAFLQPAMDLDQEEFWQHQDTGLAVFIAEGFFRYYQVPIEMIELVVVSDRFHLKPLIPLLTGNERFYLLTLGQRDVRLLEGTRYGIREVEIEGMPKSMDEALNYDETAKDEQRRQGGGAGRAALQGGGSYHGQGGERENVKEDLLQYFNLVDKALNDFFRNRR
ncbi:MAG: hypothetical protein F6K28_45740, partial [Microcoleus sp. SIO2G3]|nr:hypothetical protein [Microcoleus sp. SIO2G3]